MAKRRPTMTSAPSRRTALRIGATAVITGMLTRWQAGAQSVVPEEVQTKFLNWSRTATGFADLKSRMAGDVVVQALRSGVTVADLSGLDPGMYRGTSLEGRLLEAWYTGVFKSGGSEQRSYDTTLMWRAAGIDPSPTTCNGGPQRWASAPSNL